MATAFCLALQYLSIPFDSQKDMDLIRLISEYEIPERA